MKINIYRFIRAIKNWFKRLLTFSMVPGNVFVEKKWVLKDINITIKKGENVALLGYNGSGKSTLLKIFSRIVWLSAGELVLSGKTVSMNVGGFLGDFTGRENIYFYGALIGMTRSYISSQFNDIVEFAGVRDFIDVPIIRYSSGMTARFCFSIGVHLLADILIIDEILATVDFAFKEKCLKKLCDIAANPNVVLIFVSHDINICKQLCERAIYLKDGAVAADGLFVDVAKLYLNSK